MLDTTQDITKERKESLKELLDDRQVNETHKNRKKVISRQIKRLEKVNFYQSLKHFFYSKHGTLRNNFRMFSLSLQMFKTCS